jgi:hypothetical protein
MEKIKKVYFCPNCRYKIETPKMLLQINVGSNVNINCGNCNKDGKNLKGVVKIKGKKLEQNN